MAISTNTEYLQKSLSRFGLSSDDIDVILADSPELTTASLDVTACKKAMYKSMSAILPVQNVSEGGYSVTWNIEGLKLWYKSLCTELGLPDALKPQIRNRSNLW